MSASLVDLFEPPCDFTRQDELFPGKWWNDGSADGLYGHRSYPPPFIERLLTKIDRDADRREALERVIAFDEKMTETIPNYMMLETQHARRKHRPPGRMWSDDGPEDGEMFYAEYCDMPRPEFWSLLMKWRAFSLELRASLDPDFRRELERGDWD